MKIFRLLMITVLIMMIILLFSGPGSSLSAKAPTKAKVGFGLGQKADKTVVSFDSPLSKAPVVIVSGQWNSVPWLTAAYKITAESFKFIFYNPANHSPVDNPQSTLMQYIAVIPDPKSPIQRAGTSTCQDGDYIKFSSKLSGNPIVVCSAENGLGIPQYASPYNIDSEKFQISLKDMDGNPAKGVVQYIAVVPGPSGIDYENVTITAGVTDLLNNAMLDFGFNLTTPPQVMVCSAYCPGVANIATSWFYSEKSFQGIIRNCGGADPVNLSKLYWFGISPK